MYFILKMRISFGAMPNYADESGKGFIFMGIVDIREIINECNWPGENC
jgi:hypothetical protein